MIKFVSLPCKTMDRATFEKQNTPMNKDFRKPTVHTMKRRNHVHDYSRRGYYHITINVTKALRQPLGQIAGHLDKEDGNADAPHVALSSIGKMVEEELRESIHRAYPMLEVQDYVIMPEHLHFLLVAHRDVVSQSGKPTHLGHVIAGFKYGCNKRYWAMTGRSADRGEGLATKSPGTVTAAGTVLGDSVAKKSLPPLFEPGYCDIMPLDAEQLATQRAYIHANPRSRLMRTMNQSCLFPQRYTVNTAVSLRALHAYLQRECPRQLTAEALASLDKRLIQTGGQIVCDSYGNLKLLSDRLLPVVCHRKDAALFVHQKARCLKEAADGAVLVSARISKGEQEILDTALHSGYPVIRIEDNGFPEIYHPSADRMDNCATGLLLLITPWNYQYRMHEENISIPFCKTMNCIAQAVCRLKDDWWKTITSNHREE